MKKETKIILLIFLVALLIRISFVFITPIKIWDETVYANLGYDLSHNPISYSFNHGWSDYVPDGSWPKAGFRAPLLPYVFSVFYSLNLNLLIQFLMPLLGSLSVVLVYLLGKEMFNQKVGLYSASLLAFIPLHVFYSSKILTDAFATFFVLFAIFAFWKGFEKNSNTWKMLFGVILALALLSRYTLLWLIPIFPIYLLIRNKSLNFLKDKHLWYSILLFFIILIPWLIYGVIQYNNPFGAFIHGFQASSYWGGTQPWSFYLNNWWAIFSISGIFLIASLFYIFYYKKFKINEIYFLLIWTFLFLIMAIYMPHKEERFILPIIPAICILNAYFIEKTKKYQWIIITVLILVSSYSLLTLYDNEKTQNYTPENICFVKASEFLNLAENNSVIITEQSPISYYYNHKETHFYPSPWSIPALKNLITSYYKNRPVYIIFSEFDMPLTIDKNVKIKQDLDTNFQTIFKCSNNTFVYRYS